MKTNTKKILIWLSSVDSQKEPFVAVDEIKNLIGDLSGSGQKSLIRHLVETRLVDCTRYDGTDWLQITKYGAGQIELEFEALSPFWADWNGEWELVLMLNAPSFDLEFRSLRKLLETSGAILLGRGVYIIPAGRDSCPNNKLRNVFGKYSSNILSTKITDFSNCGWRAQLFKKIEFESLKYSYSSISKEIDQLIVKTKSKKKRNYQSINDKLAIYHRLYDLGVVDGGLCSWYMSETASHFGNISCFSDLLLSLKKI